MKKNKNKFKENFKNRFRKVFGSDENISFKISSAFLISAIIFGILGWIHKDDNYLTTALTYASSMGFAFWMVIAKGIEYSGNVIYELVRLLVFLTILVLLYGRICPAVSVSRNGRTGNILRVQK